MTAALPLPEGDRIVSLMNWDASTSNHERRLLNDLSSWRGMTSVEDIGVSRNVERTLIVDQPRARNDRRSPKFGVGIPRRAACRRLRGRHLLPEDERPGAPDVIVIGHDEWLRRFDADPDIVGRSLQLGQHHATPSSASCPKGLPSRSTTVSGFRGALTLAVRAAHRPGGQCVREARAGRHARERASRARRDWPARGREHRRPRTSTCARGSCPTPMPTTTWTIR